MQMVSFVARLQKDVTRYHSCMPECWFKLSNDEVKISAVLEHIIEQLHERITYQEQQICLLKK